MAERIKSEKWLVILFFSTVSLFLGYMIYYLISYNLTVGEWAAAFMARQAALEADGENIVLLSIDKEITIGRVKMTYRGIETKMIIIDYVILDLDPNYSYHRRISIDEAKRGFYLSNNVFRLESAGRYSMRVTPGSAEIPPESSIFIPDRRFAVFLEKNSTGRERSFSVARELT